MTPHIIGQDYRKTLKDWSLSNWKFHVYISVWQGQCLHLQDYWYDISVCVCTQWNVV